jgi:hypothetical protein
MPEFYLTKPDTELISCKNARDPLGTQVITSAMGRRIIRNLTENSRDIRGFQLLITTFALYDLFNQYCDKNRKDIKDKLKKSSFSEVFSLENFFILCEQAFAYSHYKVRGNYPLPGSRQVAASIESPGLSLGRPILQSQLVNGVWGLYRNAAIRSDLIDPTGKFLTPDVKQHVLNRLKKNMRTYTRFFNLIRDSLLNGFKELPPNKNHQINQILSDVIHKIPDKRLLQKHLLMDGKFHQTRQFAEYAYQQLHRAKKNRRLFFKNCTKKFPDNEKEFDDIIKCEDFIGTLDSVFIWLLNKSDRRISSISRELTKQLNLKDLERAKHKYQKYEHILEGSARSRSGMFIQTITTSNPVISWKASLKYTGMCPVKEVLPIGCTLQKMGK